MTHFFRPKDVGFDGYTDKPGVGLRAVYVPMHEWRDVVLAEGFDAANKPLVVRPTDATSRVCPVGFTEMSPVGGDRRFRFTAVYLGGTTVEAVPTGTRGASASVQVTVINPAPVVARKPLKLGRDGPIPIEFQPILIEALDAAWALSKKPGFVESFRNAVSILSGKEQRSAIYAESLNRAVFHLLDKTANKRVRDGLAVEQQDIQDQAVSGVAPRTACAMSPTSGFARVFFAPVCGRLRRASFMKPRMWLVREVIRSRSSASMHCTRRPAFRGSVQRNAISTATPLPSRSKSMTSLSARGSFG